MALIYKKQTTEKNPPTPVYYTAKKEARFKDNTIFINASVKNKKESKIIQIVENASSNKMDVYIADAWKNILNKTKGVHYLKDKTKEFYRELFSAKYVYTDSRLNNYYVKDKKQILIVDFPKRNRENLDTKIAIDSIYPISDYVLKKNNEEQILSKLCKGTLQAGKEKKTAKKSILFMFNMKYYNRLFCYALHMLQNIDLDAYNVTLLLHDKERKEYGDILNKLDTRIRIVMRKGRLLCDGAKAKRLEYYESCYNDIPIAKIYREFRTETDYEAKRLFGGGNFDYIFNMKYDILYFRLLICGLNGKKVLFMPEDKASDINRLGQKKLDYYKSYDEIVCTNRNIREMLIKSYDINDGMVKTVCMTDMFVTQDAIKEDVIINNKKKHLLRLKKSVDLDRYEFVLGDGFDGADYLVIPPYLNAADALAETKKRLGQSKKLVVFDLFNAFDDTAISKIYAMSDEVWIKSSFDEFDGAVSYLSKRIDIDCDEGFDYTSKTIREIIKKGDYK